MPLSIQCNNNSYERAQTKALSAHCLKEMSFHSAFKTGQMLFNLERQGKRGNNSGPSQVNVH